MSEDRDERFVATGPSDGSGVRHVTGFFTYANKLDYGVNVQGHKCGVYGESLNRPGSGAATARETPHDGIGVCGVGDYYGVFGKGDTLAGVYGENNFNGTGVFGVALDDTAIGLAGICKFHDSRDLLGKSMSSGVGIVGLTESGRGYGVVGASVDPLTDTTPTSVPTPFVDPRTGTPSIANLSSGIGVFGASGTGTGVYGKSSIRGGRGGTFESSTLAAQVRLIPDKQETLTPQLPKDGKVGDLLVIRNTAKNVDGEIQDSCSLWLCIPTGQSASEDSPVWREVMLGQEVVGLY